MDERDKKLIIELKEKLSSDLGERLRKIIVFGSRVRGEATEASDIDVIALVDEKTPEIEKRLEDIAYHVMWDHDFRPIISLRVFAESQFNSAVNRGFSFYRHVEEEGVTV